MVTIEEITLIQAPVERCFDLARSVEAHLEGNVHGGEPAIAVAGATSGLLSLGQRVTWRAKHFGFRHTLTTEITAVEPPTYFQDRMTRGAFRFMRHDHFFRPVPPAATEMRDVFVFAAPLPVLGRIAELILLHRYMQVLLHERNVVIRQIAESSEWRHYLPQSLES